MTAVLLALWRLIRGPLQWRVLWLVNSKFIVNASGVGLDDRGRVLLLRHRFWPDHSWGIPGGYVHRGEVLEGALVREVHEETGLSISVGQLVRLNSGYELRLEVVFLARITGGELQPDPHELPDGLLPAHRTVVLEVLRPEVQDGG